MISSTGRYIHNNTTETGLYNTATSDETGIHGVGIPRVIILSRFFSSVVTISQGESRHLSEICNIGDAGNLSTVLVLSAGNTRELSSQLEIINGFHSDLSSPCMLGNVSSCSAMMQVGFSFSTDAASYLSIDGEAVAVVMSHPLQISDGTAVVSTAPLSLAQPQVINAPYSVQILIDDQDVTALVRECTTSSNESAIFDTINCTLPNGSRWDVAKPPAIITVILPDETRRFMVEEFNGDGAVRTIWGRPESAIYADPWSGIGVWNDSNPTVITAADLATTLCGAVWTADSYPLPPRYEVEGIPSEALATLARAHGCIVASSGSSLSVRKKWPVRPVDMSSATVIINRETALELSIDKTDQPRYGSVLVNGWSPDALLPKLDVEGSPVLGQSAYVRAYWRGKSRPSRSSWATDGNYHLMGEFSETITDTVVFTDGTASVAFPIWSLQSFTWLGQDYGEISWLENGYSTEIESANPGHGVARITYTTQYERWQLSGQAVDTVLFGVDVSSGAVAANIQLASGGAAAGEVKESLLGTTAACVQRGSALLDDSRVAYTVRATLPRTARILTGAVAYVEDSLTGISGFGKVTGVDTKISDSRITQAIEVALC